MPQDVPQANYIECKAFGSKVTLVDGLISDCAKIVNAGRETEGWFDVSTLKEPYRIEGKKTMGYELAEQMGWELPDVIFYPTGGGVGIIGMWNAFEEMETMGWIGARRPKMIAVQVEGCQPVVRAFERGEARSQFWDNAHTVASGLRVPKPLGDFLVLQAVRESGGTAIAVSDAESFLMTRRLAAEEALLVGGSCGMAVVAALRVAEQAGPTFARGETGIRMHLGGLVMESIPLERRAATLDLVMLIIETTGSLSGSIGFNTDLFDRSTIVRMAGHFQALLESVIRDPAVHQRVCDEVSVALLARGCEVLGWVDSPITGAQGNREFLVHARLGRAGSAP
jgi:cysteine synthase